MKAKIPYQITLRWDEPEDAWLACVPALRGCLAYGDTPAKALKEVGIAAELWLAAAEAHGKPVPRPDATLERLASLTGILNMTDVARQANLSPQTLASKLKRGTPLSEKERGAVGEVLASHGLG